MINVIMTGKNIKIGIDQILEMEEFNLVVEYTMGSITEVHQGINKIIEIIIEEVILESL